MNLIGQKYLQGHSPGEHEGPPAGSAARLRQQDRGFGVVNEAILYDGLPGLAKYEWLMIDMRSIFETSEGHERSLPWPLGIK